MHEKPTSPQNNRSEMPLPPIYTVSHRPLSGAESGAYNLLNKKIPSAHKLHIPAAAVRTDSAAYRCMKFLPAVQTEAVCRQNLYFKLRILQHGIFNWFSTANFSTVFTISIKIPSSCKAAYSFHSRTCCLSQSAHSSIPSPVLAQIGMILISGFIFLALSIQASISNSK